MKYEGKKGITLIALVITIIILLILAGVSIATLTGQNGLLNKANTAKIETKKASAKEKVQLAVMESLDNSGSIHNNELKTNLNKVEGIDKNSIPETITDDTYPFTVTVDGYKIKIDKNGKVTVVEENIGGDTSKPSEEENLGKNLLIINPDAEDEASKSPYVKYNEMLCRVLYNDNTHGIQITTVNNVEDFCLGSADPMVSASDFSYNGPISINNDFKKAVASYNNLIDNLNNKAKSYMDKNGTALDARCLGSDPIITTESKFKGDSAGWFSGEYDYLSTYGWNGKFKLGDNNYLEDVGQLKSLGFSVDSKGTHLASRYMNYGDAGAMFGSYTLLSNGNATDFNMFSIYSETFVGKFNVPTTYERGFRPVFLIPSNTVISSGNGSFDEPYIID